MNGTKNAKITTKIMQLSKNIEPQKFAKQAENVQTD